MKYSPISEHIAVKARRAVALLLIVIFLSSAATAFDTGPHSDLTRAALLEHKFAADPIKIVQVENWLTDYYTSVTIFDGEKKEALESLHFDNLFNTAQVANYWGRFIENLRLETREAATKDDPLQMLVVMGIAFHAVQDFYTHSNWVETHPRPPDASYRTDTFLNSGFTGPGLVTGKYPPDRATGPGPDPIPDKSRIHGGYTGEDGLNKDSQVRLRWDEAYIFAYVASYELVTLMEKWAEEARSGFWKSVREYRVGKTDAGKLKKDVDAHINISMCLNLKGEDGHWKGNRSGSGKLIKAVSKNWARSPSVFVERAKEGSIQKRLASQLYSNRPLTTTLTRTEKFALKRRAVLVRTVQVKETSRRESIIEKALTKDPPDYFSLTTVGGLEYRDRTIEGSRDAAYPWFVIHIVDQSEGSVPIKIAVWEEDLIKNDLMDANPLKEKKAIDLHLRLSDNQLSGDIENGIFSNSQNFFTLKGDSNRSAVQIGTFVTNFLLQ